MAQPLTIDIRNGTSNGSNQQAIDNRISLVSNNSSNIFKNAITGIYSMKLANTGLAIGKSIIQYNVSQIGNSTGNYMRQESVEKALEIGSLLMNTTSGIIMGVALGNPTMTIISATASIAQFTVSQVQAQSTYNLSNAKVNYQSGLIGDNLGIILNGGNR